MLRACCVRLFCAALLLRSATAPGVLTLCVTRARQCEGIAWGWLGWPGGDRLSRALGRSIMGAGGFHVRVRDGIGCWPAAMATRPSQPTPRNACVVALCDACVGTPRNAWALSRGSGSGVCEGVLCWDRVPCAAPAGALGGCCAWRACFGRACFGQACFGQAWVCGVG